MNQEVSARLRRLGVVKGIRGLQSSSTSTPSSGRQRERAVPLKPNATRQSGPSLPLEKLLPALALEETVDGACYALDKVFPISYRHGSEPLSSLFELSPAPAATFCEDERLADRDFRDFLFLDTETTGLSGAGTLATEGERTFIDDELLVGGYAHSVPGATVHVGLTSRTGWLLAASEADVEGDVWQTTLTIPPAVSGAARRISC